MNTSISTPKLTTALPDGSVRFTRADTRYPAVALLSNGRYSVMITAAGAGYSTWRNLDVTRWREDRTRDCWGQFCYIRDLGSERSWSVGHQPLGRAAIAGITGDSITDLPVLSATTAGLLASPSGQGPFLMASALFFERSRGITWGHINTDTGEGEITFDANEL